MGASFFECFYTNWCYGLKCMSISMPFGMQTDFFSLHWLWQTWILYLHILLATYYHLLNFDVIHSDKIILMVFHFLTVALKQKKELANEKIAGNSNQTKMGNEPTI